MSPRIVVAGAGNIFLGDDGFGTEVVRRLGGLGLPGDVLVADFGVAAVHLAYQLLDGCDELILVDASPRGEVPGSVYVIEPELDGDTGEDPTGVLIDAHALTPDAVLGFVARLGSRIGRVRVVGCEPANLEEGIGLSEPVAAAVDVAVDVVRRLINEQRPVAAEGR